MNGPVVLPVTGNGQSLRVLPVAAMLARQRDCVLHLVHVRNPLSPFAELLSDAANVLHDAHQTMERAVIQRIAAEQRNNGSARIEVAELEGDVAGSIARYARAIGADYVVMNARAIKNTPAVAWRGIVEHIAVQTHLPMLVVPEAAPLPGPGAPFRRILVALDGRPGGEAVLGPVIELALPNADVTLLHVIRRGAHPQAFIDPAFLPGDDSNTSYAHCAETYLSDWVERLSRHGIRSHALIVTHRHVLATIVREALRTNADLIAVALQIERQHTPLRIGRSVAGLVRTAPAPLLLCNAPIERCTPLSYEIETDLALRCFPIHAMD